MGVTTLPEAKTSRRPRSAFAIFIEGGMEALTRALYRGDAFDNMDDLATLHRRCTAFQMALSARVDAAGIVIEDEADE